ncbi:MAG: hypothetical protein Q8K63_01510 [Acidimicrobiales bacterium]|nr:hypothetical protein [Acidimicrobiales bacterium]
MTKTNITNNRRIRRLAAIVAVGAAAAGATFVTGYGVTTSAGADEIGTSTDGSSIDLLARKAGEGQKEFL